MTVDLPDWTRQVRLIGTDADGNLVAIAVDAEGHAISQIYGVYDTTLKPLLTDWQGRLLIVPYDEKDIWGKSIHVGMGELAARLWSPRRFDKAGETLAMTSFEHGFGTVDKQPTGMGVAATLVSEIARTGAFAAKLAIGPGVAACGGVEWYVVYPPGERYGIEVSYGYDETWDYYELFLGQYSYGRYRLAGIKHDLDPGELYYWNPDNDWTPFEDECVTMHPTFFYHTTKLVIDTVTEKYTRLMVDSYSFDMTAYSFRAEENFSPPTMWALFRFYPDGETAVNVYIDDLIFTINEPE